MLGFSANVLLPLQLGKIKVVLHRVCMLQRFALALSLIKKLLINNFITGNNKLRTSHSYLYMQCSINRLDTCEVSATRNESQ